MTLSQEMLNPVYAYIEAHRADIMAMWKDFVDTRSDATMKDRADVFAKKLGAALEDADRNEVFGEFPFPAFIDLFFDVAFLTYPKEHDSGESGTERADVDGENVHPVGDDALD